MKLRLKNKKKLFRKVLSMKSKNRFLFTMTAKMKTNKLNKILNLRVIYYKKIAVRIYFHPTWTT